MSAPKPSEVAMRAEASLGNCTCTPQYPDGDRKCDCPGCTYLQYQVTPELSLAIQRAIDSAIQSARREAIEECRRAGESAWEQFGGDERFVTAFEDKIRALIAEEKT